MSTPTPASGGIADDAVPVEVRELAEKAAYEWFDDHGGQLWEDMVGAFCRVIMADRALRPASPPRASENERAMDIIRRAAEHIETKRPELLEAPPRAADAAEVESFSPQDQATRDQIAAIMLQHGTEGQRTQALEYCATQPEEVRTAGEIAEDERRRVVLNGLLTAKDVSFNYGAGWRAVFQFDGHTEGDWRALLLKIHADHRAASRQAHQDQREEGGR